jgi:nucleotide-binding universal stress UspA family protein
MANPNKVGLVIGALIGGWHFVWSLLVLIGWAQPIIDFIKTRFLGQHSGASCAALALSRVCGARKKRPSKSRPPLTINTVLVPVDFSARSREGLQYAIGFANEFGARIILLHATYLGYIYPSAMYDVRSVQEAARKDAERQMRELVRRVKFGRVKFETALTSGSPVLDICAFTQDHDVDLIITSTHGLTGLKHVLIGSIAEQVVRHAPCSVLVVPSHPKIRVAKLTRRVERGRKTRRQIANTAEQKYLSEREKFTRKYRKLGVHAFPERRKTNKFRESHISG